MPRDVVDMVLDEVPSDKYLNYDLSKPTFKHHNYGLNP